MDNSYEKTTIKNECILLTSIVYVSNGWYTLFHCVIELHCPATPNTL